MRPWYRFRQFRQALTAAPGTGVPAELGPGLRELYLRMPPADRAHGLQTYTLLAAGESPPVDLRIAALLHDVGKSTPQIHLWDRALFAVAGWLAPGWLRRRALARQSARWAGLAALQSHAERGARLVAAAGGPARAVALIRHHHAAIAGLGWPKAESDLLAALQEADESC